MPEPKGDWASPWPLESADQVVQAFAGPVSMQTRSPTALIFPLERLVRELDGVEVLLDGAHAPGMVEIDLQQLRPTYYLIAFLELRRPLPSAHGR